MDRRRASWTQGRPEVGKRGTSSRRGREKVTPPSLLRPLHAMDTIAFSGVVVKASEARSKSNAPLQYHLLELTPVIGGESKW
jgi:hypothetical protein